MRERTPTPAVLAWLHKLRDEGPQTRPRRSKVGYLAMAAGLTKWCATNDHDWREELTEAGRAALEGGGK
ncbi:hypothetical protein IHQ56_14260 [Methylobacillus flagellatus]|uniref:hypothetical protein n=1 Tax=Methylobacillus flagellatus TaxID=405 RepID=UPI002853C2E0|nr:hypothetical protein [Methylobacillus flagellatus]MDR5172972.1 hypothetical protein [Methylobacillus flagellatus]